MNYRVRAIIKGRVQGVFFRMETKNCAVKNQVTGWVRNLPDGTVEAVFEGEKKDVEAVLDWCQKGGPPHGRVDDIFLEELIEENQFDSFSIRY